MEYTKAYDDMTWNEFRKNKRNRKRYTDRLQEIYAFSKFIDDGKATEEHPKTIDAFLREFDSDYRDGYYDHEHYASLRAACEMVYNDLRDILEAKKDLKK